jgi:hypothetical protein
VRVDRLGAQRSRQPLLGRSGKGFGPTPRSKLRWCQPYRSCQAEDGGQPSGALPLFWMAAADTIAVPPFALTRVSRAPPTVCRSQSSSRLDLVWWLFVDQVGSGLLGAVGGG